MRTALKVAAFPAAVVGSLSWVAATTENGTTRGLTVGCLGGIAFAGWIGLALSGRGFTALLTEAKETMQLAAEAHRVGAHYAEAATEVAAGAIVKLAEHDPDSAAALSQALADAASLYQEHAPE